MACDYSLEDSSLGRPILGVINLCPGAVSAAVQAAGGKTAAMGGSVVDVVVHEILHALGLSATMYSSWLDLRANSSTSSGELWGSQLDREGLSPAGYPSGGIRLQGATAYLATPSVTERVQRMLNCTRVRGLWMLEPMNPLGSITRHADLSTPLALLCEATHKELLSP
jgi:hypothetical protein